MSGAFSACWLRLQPSRLGQLQVLLCLGLALGTLATGRWPLWLGLLLVGPVLAWGWRAWALTGQQHPDAVLALAMDAHGLVLRTRAGRRIALRPDPRPWVTGHLLLLRPRSPVTGATWPLVLWRDALDGAGWAALRRAVRYQMDMAGPGGSVSGGSMGTSTVS